MKNYKKSFNKSIILWEEEKQEKNYEKKNNLPHCCRESFLLSMAAVVLQVFFRAVKSKYILKWNLRVKF
jgi:hypothetical protein